MTQKDDGWWFVHDGLEYGPYDTKKEAEDDQRGLKRFDKYKDDPDFIPSR